MRKGRTDDSGGARGESARSTVPRGASAAILAALALGERSVSELVEATGLSQPNVSNHLARLRNRGLVQAERRGRTITYRLASAGLATFLLAPPGADRERDADPEQVAARFLEGVLSLREEDAARVVDLALGGGLDWREIYLRVFAPALVEVGRRWERGELAVATEHLITGIVFRQMHRLSASLPLPSGGGCPTAVVACIEGELHTLGGRMVADFLIAQGWRVFYLNGFLPTEHLLDAVRRHRPDAVLLCVTNDSGGSALADAVRELHACRGSQPLPLLVAGGRYFEQVEEVPGLDLAGTDVERVTGELHRRVQTLRGAASPD